MKKLMSILLSAVVVMGIFTQGGCKKEEKPAESLELFINNGNYFDGVEKDVVWKEIENKTGVTFNITGEAHSGSYYTKLSPLMNTLVDAPDIAFIVPTSDSLGTTTFSDVWCAPKKGLIYSYDELLSKYPEGTYPYIENVLYKSQFKNIVQNGKHHLLPYITSANSWGIYYRKDWLITAGYYTNDENGNKVARYPVNMDEFTDVLEKFSRIGQLATEQKITLKQTPDRTYGFSPASGPHSLMPIYHAFGVTPDWDIYDNSIDYMYTNAKFRNFLEWASDVYSKGYIYPTFNSLASNGERQLFYDGKIGVMFTNAETHVKYIMQKATSLGIGDQVGIGPAIEGTKNIGEEGSKGFSDWGGYWGGFCISKMCKHPENALKLLDFFLSPEGTMLKNNGIEGRHYAVENGKIVINEQHIANRMLDGSIFQEFENSDGELLPTGTYKMGSYFSGNIKWDKFASTGLIQREMDAYSMDQKYTDIVQSALDEMVLKSSKLVNFTAFPGSTVSAMNAFADSAKSYVNSVIIGANGYSLDEWDVLVAKLKTTNKSKAMYSSANAVCREYGFLK